MTPRWIVRPVRTDEFEPWSVLFRGYAEFYRWPASDAHQRQIWDWIHERGTVEALVAVPVDADTADDNYRARSVYDTVATRTTWITYDMSAADG